MSTPIRRDLADWDENVIELSVGPDFRVVLNTIHGQVILDVLKDDVNAFVLTAEGRKDFQLLKTIG